MRRISFVDDQQSGGYLRSGIRGEDLCWTVRNDTCQELADIRLLPFFEVKSCRLHLYDLLELSSNSMSDTSTLTDFYTFYKNKFIRTASLRS